ncbi:MAG: hypothetical protein Q9209_002198 [Squamulea sp. 1 TL-2023]
MGNCPSSLTLVFALLSYYHWFWERMTDMIFQEIITSTPQQAINLDNEPWVGIRGCEGEAIIGVVDDDTERRLRLYASMATLEHVVHYYLDQCRPGSTITETADELMDTEGEVAEASKYSESSSQGITSPLRIPTTGFLIKAVDAKGKQIEFSRPSHLHVRPDRNSANKGPKLAAHLYLRSRPQRVIADGEYEPGNMFWD